MNLDAVAKFISGVGFPIALVMTCLWALWQVGRFLAPLVTRFTEQHITLMQSLEETTKRQADNAQRQTELLQANTSILSEIHGLVKGHQ